MSDELAQRSTKRDYIVAIASGLFALAGVVVGTLLSVYYGEKQFDRQFILAQRDKIMTKRVDLIEQCSRVRADLDRAKVIMRLVDVEELRVLAMAKAKKKEKEDLEKIHTGVYSVEMQKEFSTIHANYLSCLQMAVIFFGPKTKDAISKMNSVKVWYADPDSPEMKEFWNAMLDEIQYFPRQES
jgi:hypothetical protein